MKARKILWVDLQPSLYRLFKRTAQTLGKNFEVSRWTFEHDLDESCNTEEVHKLLKQTIGNASSPVHLIGHGISGTVAYQYAQKYPRNISSLLLLSVDANSSNQWTNYYQSMRSQLPCPRQHILSHLSSLLIDSHSEQIQEIMSKMLAKCLDNDFIYGSIIKSQTIENLSKINLPTLIINSSNDFVVNEQSHERWMHYLKPGDCYQNMAKGRHFFPFTEWIQTAEMISAFIEMIPEQEENIFPECYRRINTNKINSQLK